MARSRTLYRYVDWNQRTLLLLLIWVVPYIGTWIETYENTVLGEVTKVVPYIGTWIETLFERITEANEKVVPYIGTWIETRKELSELEIKWSRTLYRYVDWNLKSETKGF